MAPACPAEGAVSPGQGGAGGWRAGSKRAAAQPCPTPSSTLSSRSSTPTLAARRLGPRSYAQAYTNTKVSISPAVLDLLAKTTFPDLTACPTACQ